MSDPVVVQGTSVSDPYGGSVQQTGEWTKGEKQEVKCRDPIFAFLFYGNVAAIAVVVGVYGPDAFTDALSGESDEFTGLIYAVLVAGAISVILSGLGFMVMMAIPALLIKVSLIFVVVLGGVIAVMSFLSGNWVGGIIGIIFFAIGICYAMAVWSRIPFATANLVTATTAIKGNCGVTIIAYIFVALAFGWSLMWTVAFAGVWNLTYECTTTGGVTECSNPSYGLLFVLFVSYFFTHQVLQNTVHVVVAGTVGTWWFAPEEAGCCSSAIIGSFIRATTTSFGSICFGSLIVAIIQALRQLANQARAEGDAGILACIAECILACIQGIVEYFNKWAYVYVGLYGYSYIEAGKNVFTLFQNRGWDAIIADDLVGNALFLVSMCVGLLTGALILIPESTTDWFDEFTGDSSAIAFTLGFIVGLVICSILLSTVASAVNAVIVLFAEAPAEFQQNYPDLSNQMREAWLGAFPGSL